MSPRGFRLTACCVTALLVLLVPIAAAEGEYWKAPDVLTFRNVDARYDHGVIAAGRVENLLENDGRTLRLADTGEVPIQFAPAIPDTVVPNYTRNHNMTAVGCVDHYDCVNDLPTAHDGNSTYLVWNQSDGLRTEELAMTSLLPFTYTPEISIHFVFETVNSPVVNFFLIYRETSGPPQSSICNSNQFNLTDAAPSHSWGVIPRDFNNVFYAPPQPQPPFVPPEPPRVWNNSGRRGYVTCTSFVIPWSQFTLDDLNVLMTFDNLRSPTNSSFRLTSLSLIAARPQHLYPNSLASPFLTHADLSLGATGYYSIRAEWTCTARTGGPYYLGALNATGVTRWFNVTRDATNATYPSGEMCPVAGATERYHAAMSSADIVPATRAYGPRVHFRLSDNASDPQGSAWGNVTLDRLVAILTQDFAVSTGNLGWLVYLGFIVTGLLIAAFAYHRWREHGSGA
jgi:hypothetical protein